jgi:hypothetical protein
MKEALQKIKDEMLKPEYEKRRHFGCKGCGHTFYGRYQKTGFNAVPNGITTPSRREGWTTVHTHSDIFYPDCPKCFDDFWVCEAKKAIAFYNHQKEKLRKKKEAAQKRKETKERKAKEYWDRVLHVKATPSDATMEELRDFNFIRSILGMPYWRGYENRKKPCWEQGQNGPYKIKFHSIHKGHSRSGKTHYYDDWFDMMNVDTGETWQVSCFVGHKKGGRKNVFEVD